MKLIVYLMVLLCFIGIVSAATIHGVIYDISLDKAEDVVVEVDTEPKQQFISKDGTYSFNVPAGEYTIEAKYYLDGLLESSATEDISVKSDGDFVLDLILFPVIDSELIEEADDISIDDDYFEERKDYSLIILFGVVIIVLLLLVYLLKMKKLVKKEGEKEQKIKDFELRGKEEDYYDKVLAIIKESKRITQKEIRKQIPLSEAKISLIIAELEHKGLIEKIKKGRGNILILKN